MTTRQLKVSDAASGGFRRNLHDRVFSVILEYNLPPKKQSLMMAAEAGLELMKYVAQEERISSVAVSEGFDREAHHGLVEVTRILRKAAPKKELILAVSGRGLTLETAGELFEELAGLKISTLTMHTGLALPDHPRNAKDRPLPAPAKYLDSCRMLRLLKQTQPETFAGARVNPFKYALPDAHLQYYKMVKKLATGADFILVQAGWDMKKYQELQWYQERRNFEEPVIARLLLLKPGDVARILEHEYGGLVISREFAARIQRVEADEDEALEAAIRRVALQAAGCRLLGYSGVQIAGLTDRIIAEAVIGPIFEALAEFDDYPAWLGAWEEMHQNVELAPGPHRYYVFTKLMEKEFPEYSEADTPPASAMLEPPARGERWRYSLAKSLGLDHRSGLLSNPVKKILCGWRPGRDWRLDKTAMLCAAKCPKGLENGPCDASWADGTCEFGHQPCFYHAVLRLAQWRKTLEMFEAPDAD